MNNIKSLIAQIKVLNDKYESIKKVNGESFNIFSILNMERDEVKTHSYFIYELLNHQGSHNQGDIFLKLFLEQILEDKEYGDLLNVEREALTSKGRRIDFIIETSSYLIGIEMKIDADDQENQLYDYMNELKLRRNKKHKVQEIELFYLTLTGYEASEKSTNGLKESKDYHNISFYYDVHAWIEKCIEKSATIPTIREGLVHYRNLIRKITNKIPNKMEEDMKNIIKEPKDVEAMQSIVEYYPKMWAEKEMEFWDELWDTLVKVSSKYKFELEDPFNIWLDESNKEFSIEEIIENILWRREKSNYSVGFLLKKEYSKNYILELWIDKEIDKSTIAQTLLFEKNQEKFLNNSIVNICDEMGFSGKNGKSKYRLIREKISFFGRYQSEEPTYELFDDKIFENYINTVSNEVTEILRLINRHENKILKAYDEK